MPLPIDVRRRAIVDAFRDPGFAIVLAPPGTGKSTRIPVFLAEERAPDRVVCIEPRRIAARSLAHRVASEDGGSPGGRIGYRVRFDNRVSGETRIEFVSRGVFLREILGDRGALGRYGAVLLDEFHERQLETDWIFGEILRRRSEFPSLRIGILSATLDPEPIRRLVPDIRLVEVDSPLHPVEIRHAARPTRFEERTVADRAVDAAASLAREGLRPDALIFLPGYREVRRTVDRLRQHPDLKGWDAVPLTGEQSPAEQDRALRAGPRPRLIVATNLAESSLTVEGVHAVIDGGLARRMDFDPSRGLNALRTVRVSLFSARQRTGRAGRIGSGVAIRLWSEREERDLPEADLPECQRLELSEWLLRLLAAGEDPRIFPWIDAPPAAHLEHAASLLDELGAMRGGSLAERGRALAALPVHPRLAALILEGARRGVAPSAARLAALLEEDRLLLPGTKAEAAFSLRGDQADYEAELRLLEAFESGQAPAPGSGARLAAVKQVLRQSERLSKDLPPEADAAPEERGERLRQCCLAAFPDRVARRLDRGTATYAGRDGTSTRLDRHCRIQPGDWILALEKREATVKGVRTAILGSVVALQDDWIAEALRDRISSEEGVFEDSSGRILRQRLVRLEALELSRETLGPASDSERASHFAAAALDGRIPLRKWTQATDAWLARVECLRRSFPEFRIPPFDEGNRRAVLEWIALECETAKEFRNAEVMPALREWLGPESLAALDELVPEALPIPGRKRPAPLDYGDPQRPRIALRIQEALRLPGHPTLAGGRIRPTLELLAPNQRPVQVTDDLDSFWTSSYPAIRKELRGRYPKHDWPENPRS